MIRVNHLRLVRRWKMKREIIYFQNMQHVYHVFKFQIMQHLHHVFKADCILQEAVAGRCSVKKVFLEISQKSPGKHLCQSLFFNKKTRLLKKRLWHRCFPVNFAKFLRIRLLTEHLRWLFCIALLRFFYFFIYVAQN